MKNFMWNLKLSRTSLCAPSWALLLSSLTTGTPLLPWLLFKWEEKAKQSLCFASTGNRPSVHVNPSTDMQSLVLECSCWAVDVFPPLAGCSSLQSCPWDPTSTELRISSLQSSFWVCYWGGKALWFLQAELQSPLAPMDTQFCPMSVCPGVLCWTSASLNLIKALPSASAAAHCNPRLGWPSRGFSVCFSWVTALLPEEKGSSKLAHSK